MSNVVSNGGADLTAGIIASHLLPGEQLLWAGRPKQGFVFRASDFWVVPFMICWSTLGVYFFISLIKQEGASVELLVFELPFLFFGGYMLFGRFWIDAKARSRTYYGVTDQRGLIISGLLFSQTRSIYLKGLLETQFTMRSDGTGTIEFFTRLDGINRFRKFGFNRSQSWWPLSSKLLPPAFEMIPHPRDVEAILLQAKQEAQQPALAQLV